MSFDLFASLIRQVRFKQLSFSNTWNRAWKMSALPWNTKSVVTDRKPEPRPLTQGKSCSEEGRRPIPHSLQLLLSILQVHWDWRGLAHRKSPQLNLSTGWVSHPETLCTRLGKGKRLRYLWGSHAGHHFPCGLERESVIRVGNICAPRWETQDSHWCHWATRSQRPS